MMNKKVAGDDYGTLKMALANAMQRNAGNIWAGVKSVESWSVFSTYRASRGQALDRYTRHVFDL